MLRFASSGGLKSTENSSSPCSYSHQLIRAAGRFVLGVWRVCSGAAGGRELGRGLWAAVGGCGQRAAGAWWD